VHRLSDLGTVYTHAAHGVSQEGFDAEWRGVDIVTLDGDMVNRCEVFDEADLDTAIARFEELSRPAAQLKTQPATSMRGCTPASRARDWDAMAEAFG